jgi:hypothetical protein
MDDYGDTPVFTDFAYPLRRRPGDAEGGFLLTGDSALNVEA